MKKFYYKSELGFALVWIGIYCLGMSVFDEISRALGVESIASAVFALAVSIFLLFWLKTIIKRVGWKVIIFLSSKISSNFLLLHPLLHP